MNSKPKPIGEEKEKITQFKSEFDEAVSDLMRSYNKTEDDAKLIIGTIIVNTLKKIQIDSDEMSFLEFYNKYVHTLRVLYYSDFTVDQLEHIIEQTPMSVDDKKIAYKIFIEGKTYNTVAGECCIAEPKTVASKKEKISDLLRITASKMSKLS
jgi:hypothetical protein